MKANRWNLLALAILTSTGVLSAAGRPIEFSEVSLLVRAHESDADIMHQVHNRKLLHPLTAQQEDLLKSQGANDALIRSLRDSRITLSTSQANALVAEQLAARNRPPTFGPRDENDSLGKNVQVFDVSYGHPVNLSQWGGPDYEIAFQRRRSAGEDLIEPTLIDSVRSNVDTSTYLGEGRLDDSTTFFDRRNYVSIVAHESARPISIDTNNPVTIKGVPYLLYPLYAARGVTLYYIGRCGDSVRLAAIVSKS